MALAQRAGMETETLSHVTNRELPPRHWLMTRLDNNFPNLQSPPDVQTTCRFDSGRIAGRDRHDRRLGGESDMATVVT
jgi:hypothetical protein